MTFRVLHVCTGNICRSPLAEHLMRAGLAARGVEGVEVASAGTRGLEGHPVQEHAAAALTDRAIASEEFRARRLLAEHVAAADLVLAATRAHRAAAVTLVPRAAARTFTLLEFDRLLAGVDLADLTDLPADPAERATALVRAAAGRRGLVRPDRPEDDDVDDPYGGPASGYPPCAALIEQALERWLALMSC